MRVVDLLARQRASVTLLRNYVNDAHLNGPIRAILFDNRARPMTQAILSPELTRQSIALARALSAAARNWALYPPEHPAAAASLARLSDTINTTIAGAAFTFGVTPKTLLVAGYPLPEEHAVSEAARLLHDHDILQLSFLRAA